MRGVLRAALVTAVLAGAGGWSTAASAAPVPAARWNPVSADAGVWPNYHTDGKVRTSDGSSTMTFNLDRRTAVDGQLCLKLAYPNGNDIPGHPLQCMKEGQSKTFGKYKGQFRLKASSGGGGHFWGPMYY